MRSIWNVHIVCLFYFSWNVSRGFHGIFVNTMVERNTTMEKKLMKDRAHSFINDDLLVKRNLFTKYFTMLQPKTTIYMGLVLHMGIGHR